MFVEGKIRRRVTGGDAIGIPIPTGAVLRPGKGRSSGLERPLFIVQQGQSPALPMSSQILVRKNAERPWKTAETRRLAPKIYLDTPAEIDFAQPAENKEKLTFYLDTQNGLSQRRENYVSADSNALRRAHRIISNRPCSLAGAALSAAGCREKAVAPHPQRISHKILCAPPGSPAEWRTSHLAENNQSRYSSPVSKNEGAARRKIGDLANLRRSWPAATWPATLARKSKDEAGGELGLLQIASGGERSEAGSGGGAVDVAAQPGSDALQVLVTEKIENLHDPFEVVALREIEAAGKMNVEAIVGIAVHHA